MKSDQAIKDTCVSKIKRSTIPPFNFQYTHIFEDNDESENSPVCELVNLEGDELPICSTFVDKKIWTVLTTRRIISFEGVGVKQHSLLNIKKWDFGDFKGHSKHVFTKGFLLLENGNIVPVFVETGRASMVMIYGIMTLSRLLE